MKKWLIKTAFLLLTTILLFVIIAWGYEAWVFRAFRQTLDRSDFYQLDSLAGHVHAPNTTQTIYWPEHASDSVTMATNNLGFKEDAPSYPKDTNYLVLVTGDSHTDGVVNNSESFPNLLEQQIEGLTAHNGGTGFYTFQNYSGFYEKYRSLNPDLFLITVYTGNDFIETYLYNQENRNAWTSLQTFWYRIRKKIVKRQTGIMSSQASAQALFFKMYPKKKAQVVQQATEHLKNILQACTNDSVELQVLLLPTQLDVDPKRRAKLKWSEADLNINRQITLDLMDQLDTLGIPYIDLLPGFQETPEGLFWNRDQHLSVKGHTRVAELIEKQIRISNELNGSN
ncbi:MAG: hypothetical protein AAF598_10070 [Bacteroidota bacterium]